jgi:hypothetical protein
LLGNVACTRFTEPCRLVTEDTTFSDPSLSGQSPTLFEGPAGDTVVEYIEWTASGQATDGGVDGGDASGEAGTTGGLGGFSSLTNVPVGARIVSVSGDGTVAIRRFPAPAELSARAGSTTNIDVTYTGAGLLFSWVEERVRTDTNGLVHKDATLRFSYASEAGAAPASSPPGGACQDCAIVTATAASRTSTYVFFNVTGAGAATAAGGLVRLSADGRTTSYGARPAWLGKGGLPQFRSSNGAVVAFTGGSVVVVDDDLLPIGGPFSTGGAFAAVVWEPGAPYGVWLDSGAGAGASQGGLAFPTLLDAGTTPEANPVNSTGANDLGSVSGTGADLLLGRFASARPPTRITTASSVHGVARDGDVYGISFAAGGRDYFALTNALGEKRGGDVDIGAASNLLGASGGRSVHRSAPGRFRVLALAGTALLTREVSCE